MTWTFTFGRPETECGAGSKISNTTNVRAWLPELLKRLGANKLLDAPCGDFNWMSRTDLSMIDYVGVDSDSSHIGAAMSKASVPKEYCPRSKSLIEADILNDRLPGCDVIMCRDFLQHLPNAQVWTALRNIGTSEAKWLIATSHDNAVNDEIEQPGQFRALNLTVNPFNFPHPARWVEDGAGRILGLWNYDEIGSCLT